MGNAGGIVALTDQQDAFAREYVANGGNARDAAREAGYANPETQAYKVLLNRKVAERIRQICALDLTARLPELLFHMLDLATNGTDEGIKFKALSYLIDRGGLALPKGGVPTVAVQVNMGKESKAKEVQSVISSIMSGRAAKPVAISGQGDYERDDSQVIDM